MRETIATKLIINVTLNFCFVESNSHEINIGIDIFTNLQAARSIDC